MRSGRKKRGNPLEQIALMVILAMVLVLGLCGTPRLGGPKRIEADGVTYIACQDAFWLPSSLDALKDNEPQNYYVRFRDAQGIDHQLKSVRMLHITDLPSNSLECLKSR